jgi:hypothetical protein
MNKSGVKPRTLSLSQGKSEGKFEKGYDKKNNFMFSNGLRQVLCWLEGKFRESSHSM